MVNRLLARLSGLGSLEEVRRRLGCEGRGFPDVSSGVVASPGVIVKGDRGQSETGKTGVSRPGVRGESEAGEAGVAREPPACEEGAGFQTCDLPLVGPLLGEGESLEDENYWDAAVFGDGGFEVDMGSWQAMADGSFSSASPFGGCRAV